jgi:hypothetical protein
MIILKSDMTSQGSEKRDNSTRWIFCIAKQLLLRIYSLHTHTDLALTSAKPATASVALDTELKPLTAVHRFACHKVILAARSDVFAAMFSHKGTTESETNEVIIKDVEPDILEQLSGFAYSGKLSRDNILQSQSASRLFTASDKYNIPRLRTVCEEVMCQDINISNAAEVLLLGYLHEAKSLQLESSLSP